MQQRHRVSLNAVRVFVIAARTGSLTAAGVELGVTASAVSHQLKKLEIELGANFFRRGHNTISLTEAGTRFYQDVASAVGLIERSAEAFYRDESEVTVHATTSLALRWLIPSLDSFRARHPEVRVRVETNSARGVAAGVDCDIDIRHFRPGSTADGWEYLARDLRRPVVSQHLLSAAADREVSVTGLPVLQCCAGNWDWDLWCAAFDTPRAALSFAHTFDTDDAALHACVAGLGVMLAPTILTLREMASGTLAAWPAYRPIETGSYRYRRGSESRVVRQFCSWMSGEMRRLDDVATGSQ